MIYCFDLDGTICTMTKNNNYKEAKLIEGMDIVVSKLYEQNYIKIFTARGASSGIDWTELTKKQLDSWNIKYHELIMNSKPSYDIFIDDKAVNADTWKKDNIPLIKGVIAGCFDVLHPGYIHMFKESKKVCNHLTIALQEDPTLERKEKIKPILTIEERKEILLSIKFIDDIIIYKTERDLENLLNINKFDVRILGEDYKNKNYTGIGICKKEEFISRQHGWSATKYKKMILEAIR